jgi:hypothetical protein
MVKVKDAVHLDSVFFVDMIVTFRMKINEGNHNMKRLLAFFLMGIFLLSACETETGIKVHDAWIRAGAPGENGAV